MSPFRKRNFYMFVFSKFWLFFQSLPLSYSIKFLVLALVSVECTVLRNPKPQYLPFVPVEHYSILPELPPLHSGHRVGDSWHRHSCVASKTCLVLPYHRLKYFKPSSQMTFGRFKVCKPPQRIEICMVTTPYA